MKAYLTSADASVYDAFVALVWSKICAEAEAPVEGIGEHPAQPLPIGYAVSKTHGFASFRWWQPSAHDASLAAGYSEAFCLPSALGQKPTSRIGFVSHSHPSETADAHLRPTCEVVEALMAWCTASGLRLEPASKPVPGFVELSALLSAQGSVPTTSAQVVAQLLDAQTELDYYRKLVAEQEEDIRQAQARLRAIQEGGWGFRPEEADVAQDGDGVAYPVDLDELPAWCEERADSLTVTSRALGGAKKSLYERPALIYAGLDFLAGPYRDNRLGKITADRMEKALLHSGLRLAGSVGPAVAGSHGDAYYLQWEGRRRFMDLHLLRGGGRDERYCLRIYFFWDDSTKRCVVGWLPSHLNNSLS